jgi:F0F1-type ATP synthase assembly protein I
MARDGATGDGPDQGGHADRLGEVEGSSAGTSASEAGDSSKATKASGLPGSRRLERIAGSARSREGSAYQGAMEATFAIVIAALLGYWADERFGTSPIWLIVGVVIGFGSFVLRLMRMAKLVQDPGDEDEDGVGKGPRRP